MRNFIQRFARDESGATAIEYALIAALIAVGIAVAAGALGTEISNLFDRVGTELQSATPSSG
jgi:pilus assembly protein Flp/PilA